MSQEYAAILTASFAAYSILFAAAAVSDLVRFTIPNLVILALVGLFVVVSAIAPFGVQWTGSLGAFALMFAAGLVIYRLGILGGGDVKLVAVGALWVGWDHLAIYIVYVTALGAASCVALVVVRAVVTNILVNHARGMTVAVPRLLMAHEGVPYGLPIAIGAILVGKELPYLGAFII